MLSPCFQMSTISDLWYFSPAWGWGWFLLFSYIRIHLLPSEYKRDLSICINLKPWILLHSTVKDPSGQDCVFFFQFDLSPQCLTSIQMHSEHKEYEFSLLLSHTRIDISGTMFYIKTGFKLITRYKPKSHTLRLTRSFNRALVPLFADCRCKLPLRFWKII